MDLGGSQDLARQAKSSIKHDQLNGRLDRLPRNCSAPVNMLTRRHFIATSTALFSSALPGLANTAAGPVSDRSKWASWDAQVTPQNYDPFTSNPWDFHPRFLPQLVQANDGLNPGDIHVDAVARYLYHIQDDGTALRFGVAIAKGNLYEPGTYSIRRKAKWPTWRPTENMIRRDPTAFEQFADGVNGGPSNPLGSRALYLFVGNRDTYLRIHGTPSPRSIGGRASSGCVRMVMAHINGLYDNVATGSTAYLYRPEETVSARS
jgi:lipoprotein-anchoring transpeptidase ErfK/SrfK